MDGMGIVFPVLWSVCFGESKGCLFGELWQMNIYFERGYFWCVSTRHLGKRKRKTPSTTCTTLHTSKILKNHRMWMLGILRTEYHWFGLKIYLGFNRLSYSTKRLLRESLARRGFFFFGSPGEKMFHSERWVKNVGPQWKLYWWHGQISPKKWICYVTTKLHCEWKIP